jgi:hypothetical protein
MHRSFALPVVEEQQLVDAAGERLAIEGLLSPLRPRLAAGIGTFQAGACTGSPTIELAGRRRRAALAWIRHVGCA